MNLELYNKFKKKMPAQNPIEFQMFLEICETYLKNHRIKNPIVVELGIYTNKQKKFYKQLLGAEHIGIDASIRRSTPDIHGYTHDPETLKVLKNKLGGRSINILFIDACHHYDTTKKDFEMYSPLCSDIVAFHDIELGRYEENKRKEAWKFWDELKEKAYRKEKEYEDFLFLSIYQCNCPPRHRHRVGIGVIIKR